jgi:hypothetical protein
MNFKGTVPTPNTVPIIYTLYQGRSASLHGQTQSWYRTPQFIFCLPRTLLGTVPIHCTASSVRYSTGYLLLLTEACHKKLKSTGTYCMILIVPRQLNIFKS